MVAPSWHELMGEEAAVAGCFDCFDVNAGAFSVPLQMNNAPHP